MAPFSYDQLSPQRREIRLCTLHPGNLDDALQCTLSIVSLDDKPVYESLSYNWGEPVFDKEIKVNACTMMLTTNLRTALRYLRKPVEFRVLWADGVCINQNDIDERSSQVGMMNDVYKNGTELQVWLGEAEKMRSMADKYTSSQYIPSSPYLEFLKEFLQSRDSLMNPAALTSTYNEAEDDCDIFAAFDILRLLADDKHFYEMPCFLLTSSKEIQAHSPWYKGLRILVTILSQPWWRRVWIVQEVILSSKATVHVSKFEAPLSTFILAIRASYEHKHGCCFSWRDLWTGGYPLNQDLAEATNFAVTLDRTMELYQRLSSLETLSLISTSREASDPRDYVYGLSGILSHSQIPVPDYRLSVAQLFEQTTRALFSDVKSIDLLGEATGAGNHNPFKLSFWVCNWSERHLPRFWNELYSAAKNTEYNTVSRMQGALTIEAALIGLVSTIGDLDNGDDMKIVLMKIEQWRSFVDPVQPRSIKTMLRILFLDVSEPREGRLTSEGMDMLEKWWEWMSTNRRFPNYHDEESIRPVQRRLEHILLGDLGCRYFETDHGLPGMGPQKARKGDRIVIAKGSNLPLVLRPRHNFAFRQGKIRRFYQGYWFVGQCYLDGIMDGEAVRPDTKWKAIDLY